MLGIIKRIIVYMQFDLEGFPPCSDIWEQEDAEEYTEYDPVLVSNNDSPHSPQPYIVGPLYLWTPHPQIQPWMENTQGKKLQKVPENKTWIYHELTLY